MFSCLICQPLHPDAHLVLFSYHHSFQHIYYDSRLDFGLLASSFHVNHVLYEPRALWSTPWRRCFLFQRFSEMRKLRNNNNEGSDYYRVPRQLIKQGYTNPSIYRINKQFSFLFLSSSIIGLGFKIEVID